MSNRHHNFSVSLNLRSSVCHPLFDSGLMSKPNEEVKITLEPGNVDEINRRSFSIERRRSKIY